jgi:hypothetical protein
MLKPRKGADRIGVLSSPLPNCTDSVMRVSVRYTPCPMLINWKKKQESLAGYLLSAH